MKRKKISKHYSPDKNYVEMLKGLGKEVWRSLGGADSYIKQERASWEK